MSYTFLVIFGFILNISSQKIEELGPLNVIKEHVTLSGFSSGGTFAQQLQISYSSVFQGVGVFSHVFYRCGPLTGFAKDWDMACASKYHTPEAEWYNTDLVHKDIKEYYEKGLIDNPTNLKDKRLYVYVGLRSAFCSPVQSLNILKVYERYIQNPYKIRTRVQDSVFVMPTDNNYGLPCTQPAANKSFIGNCGFSGANEALQFLLADNFNIRYPKPCKLRPKPQLRYFNQKPYLTGLKNHQMDDVGTFYVPLKCRLGFPCLFHVFFHGCWNSRNLTGDNFILNSGYLEVAEKNDIIMIFPQNNPVELYNTSTRGCWNVFGSGGDLLCATQHGEQIEAVKRMIEAVMGPIPYANPPSTTTQLNVLTF